MKTTTNGTLRVATRAKKWRFNPLTNLKPDSLARHLDGFDAGHLRDAALVWDALEQRDDLLRGVISKRKKSVARHGWTVLPKSDLCETEMAAAREQVEALQFFYTIVQGALLEPAASGRVQTLGAGAGTHHVVGRALDAAGAAGDVIEVDPFYFLRVI